MDAWSYWRNYFNSLPRSGGCTNPYAVCDPGWGHGYGVWR